MIHENWAVLIAAGFFIGLDKGGIKPLLVISMFILTKFVPVQQMIAILIPVLFIGEIYPFFHYRPKINKRAVYSFLPWAFLGIVGGILIGGKLSEQGFMLTIAIIILIMAVLTTLKSYKNFEIPEKYNKIMTIFLGTLAGFSSTIGNAAGPLSNTYFLNKTKTKEELIGSNALLYLFVNGFKILMYALWWKIFSAESFLITLFLIPFIFAGIAVATKLVKVISENVYKIIVLVSIYYGGISFLVAALK